MFTELVDRVAELCDGALGARLRSVEQRRRELAAEEAVVLAEMNRRKVYRADGHASMWGKLRAELGWSEGECRQRMRIARLVAEFADIGESLAEGQMPVASAAEIGRGLANPRCGDQIVDVIGLLANEACRLEHDELRRLVRRWEVLADIDGAHREFDSADQARNAHVGTFDGIGHVAAQFGATDGAEAQEIFERFCDAEFMADWRAAQAVHGDDTCKSHLIRTDAQRRADALMAIFRSAAGSPPGSKLPEPTLNVLADVGTFEEIMVRAGLFPAAVRDPWDPSPTLLTRRRCETTTGELVDPMLVAKIAVEGHVRRVICNSAGAVIDHGQRQRLFRGAGREAVMLQSSRCIHPGCRVRVGNCEADHLRAFARGGATRPDNGGPMCRRHNLRKSHGYRVHRDATGHWHTFRPDGTEIC